MMTAAKIVEHESAATRPFCDVTVLLGEDFALQSGERLSRPEIHIRLHGDADKPAVAVAGGISAGRVAADAGAVRGWWRDIVGEDRAIDLNRFCVVAFDFLPNPREAATTIATADQARALAIALEHLKIDRLRAFAGASYGGMVALAFAALFPAKLERLVVISAADRPHPAATAVRGVQRRIIELATRFGAAEEGVSLARQLAMIGYRTADEFEARFDHRPGPKAGDPYPVCDYLIARGEAYQMAPTRYVTLSDSIDRHAVDPTDVAARGLYVAVTSDRLVPPSDIRRLAEGARGRFVEIESAFGHDAFLKEHEIIGGIVKSFIEER